MDLPLLIKGCEERKSAEKTVITSKKLQGKLIKCVWAKSIALSLGACIKLSKQHFKGHLFIAIILSNGSIIKNNMKKTLNEE